MFDWTSTGDKCFAEARSVSKRFSFGQACKPSLFQKKKNSTSKYFQETNVLRCNVLLGIMTLVIGA